MMDSDMFSAASVIFRLIFHDGGHIFFCESAVSQHLDNHLPDYDEILPMTLRFLLVFVKFFINFIDMLKLYAFIKCLICFGYILYHITHSNLYVGGCNRLNLSESCIEAVI